MIERKFKVLRPGISLKQADGSFKSPKTGTTISLNDMGADHLLSEDPPYVEEIMTKTVKEKEDA